MAVSGVNNECFAYDNPSSTQPGHARESGQRNELTHIARAYACQFAKRFNSPFHAIKADGSAGRGKNMNKVNGQSDRVITERITGLHRGRPILMTTTAALFGALPLIISTGMGSELRRPLGVTIVGGLIFSQALTLYTTPVVYLYFDRLREWWESRREQTIRRGQTTVGLPDAV